MPHQNQTKVMFKLDIPLDKIKPKYLDEASQFIKIDKMDVHYKVEGDGKPLILLHDAGSSLQIWDNWVPLLTPYFKVIRLDLPGFGLTPKSEKFNYQIDSYIYFIKKFTAELGLGLEMFSIGGAGFGGHIAWQYTLLHQHKVTKLLLINAQGYTTLNSLSLFQFDTKSNFGKFLLRWRGTKQYVDKLLKKSVGNQSIVTDGFVQQTQDFLLVKDVRHSLVTLANNPPKERIKRLSEIKTPTLIQSGSLVEKTKFDTDLPNTTSKMYNGIGLLPMLELPDRTAQDVIQFLK